MVPGPGRAAEVVPGPVKQRGVPQGLSPAPSVGRAAEVVPGLGRAAE